MAESGLREVKKARTRRHIAETAARLFAERGYEQVAVSEVARAAEVAEQTLYNYFPTKEHLVIDREQQIQAELDALIRNRPDGTSPAAAVRDFILATVADIPGRPAETARGNLGYLAANSPAVNRLVLEMIDRLAVALATAIGETTPIPPAVARLQGIALAGVFRILIAETGGRTHQGQSPTELATALRPELETLLTELDHWFTR
jgi:AcrR family transcriptional regulator